MKIQQSPRFKRDYKKLKNPKDIATTNAIINILIGFDTLYDVVLSPFKGIYHIEQKKGNLKEYYTARVNSKYRIIMKPIGTYPYNLIEIESIELIEINKDHYGGG